MKLRLFRCYVTLQKQPASIGPISQACVTFHASRSWLWTFTIKGKTVYKKVSEEQETKIQQAIENHKRVEEIVGGITRTLILKTLTSVQLRNQFQPLLNYI
jgi:hypothetical protein